MAVRVNQGVKAIKSPPGMAATGQGRSRRRRWRSAPALRRREPCQIIESRNNA